MHIFCRRTVPLSVGFERTSGPYDEHERVKHAPLKTRTTRYACRPPLDVNDCKATSGPSAPSRSAVVVMTQTPDPP